MNSIYLVNPLSSPQAYFGAEVHASSGFDGAQLVADLAIVTVAGFVPPDFSITLCDEQLTPVNLDTAAEVVGLTGKISQGSRLIELADEFRRRGKVVLVGGPMASLDPDTVRPHCDILVRGELESVAATLFADLRAGRWQDEYVGERTDLSLAPLPRWDLYPNHRAFLGSVQTARGCPFECDFCDVPAYVGRKQRHKPMPQVLAELDQLYRLGYRSVFLADDNFTVDRQHAKALLAELAYWNRRQDAGPVTLSTQVSLDAARDDELLALCARAGINTVFIGLETPNETSLRESSKRQNLVQSVAGQIDRFIAHGIVVISGLIVGFDADGPDIFERQRQFVASLPIPIFSLGALVAPTQTPLYERLRTEGRLIPGMLRNTATPWSNNLQPLQMSREELLTGVQDLGRAIYSPQAFGDRLVQLLQRLGPSAMEGVTSTAPRSRLHDRLQWEFGAIIRQLAGRGTEERKMLARVTRQVMWHRPELLEQLRIQLRFYAQVRSVYDGFGTTVA